MQTINEVSRRNSTAKAKLKATSQQDQIYTCGNSISRIYSPPTPKVTHEPITRIISKQLDIKLGPFTQELNSVLRKIKNRKAAGLDELPPEVLKAREFDDMLL